MSGSAEIMGRREHHLSNVVPIRRRARPVGRHPSLSGRGRVEMFDQDAPSVADAAGCVLLTPVEAQLIASVLEHARGHVPSPRACDEAHSLLARGVRP